MRNQTEISQWQEKRVTKIPTNPFSLMKSVYKKVFPNIHQQLAYWKVQAEKIPDEELRKQALASIATKQFHCEGGGLYALLAFDENVEDVYAFIVAYQTISDYLDNLCDRSMSDDGKNFRQLHQAMVDAIAGTSSETSYYLYQDHQEDGGYLLSLVQACQRSLNRLPQLDVYKAEMLTLCQLYCDLQVYKHIDISKREEALISWWKNYQSSFSQLEWYEFAAATGSTLGIFYCAALASHTPIHEKKIVAETENLLSNQPNGHQVFKVYFPYVQGLHILMDYLIDQEEDRVEGDLNFCFYYPSEEEKKRRFEWIYAKAAEGTSKLPHAHFHHMVVDGLLGLYLADKKLSSQADVKLIKKNLLRKGRWTARFFYLNGWFVHRIGKKV